MSLGHCLSLHFKFLLVIRPDVGINRYSEPSLGIPVAEGVGCFTIKLAIIVILCPESSKRSIPFKVLAEKESPWWPFFLTHRPYPFLAELTGQEW